MPKVKPPAPQTATEVLAETDFSSVVVRNKPSVLSVGNYIAPLSIAILIIICTITLLFAMRIDKQADCAKKFRVQQQVQNIIYTEKQIRICAEQGVPLK